MPETKLMPPSTSMKIRNPVGLSERCGVSTAEKIARVRDCGRRCRMPWRLTIGRAWSQEVTSSKPASAPVENGACRRKTACQGARRRRTQRGRATTRPPPARCRNGPRPRSRKRSAASRPPSRSRRRRACSTSIPFTLLVAVVLSAQATDAGVNKATPALFAAADTPAKMVGARRGAGARADQDHRPLPHQGEECRRPVEAADRAAWRRGAARRARRSRRCPASAARPPMSCSTSRSASRPSRSIPTSSASATAPGSRPARRRSRSRASSTRWCPPSTSSTPTTG